ncbi:MAG: hypothetical protein HKN78_00290 [Sphingomonadaceae bacterium]|nr:hypothetical protein [Sphingomonadaceae bacterium]
MTIKFLKAFLLFDGASTFILAIAFLAAGTQFSSLFGLAHPYLFWGGWICLGAAAILIYAGTRAVPPVSAVWEVAAINLGWVTASIAVFEIEYAALTTLGSAAILGLAGIVLVAALVQIAGARMLSRRAITAA